MSDRTSCDIVRVLPEGVIDSMEIPQLCGHMRGNPILSWRSRQRKSVAGSSLARGIRSNKASDVPRTEPAERITHDLGTF